MPRFKLQTLLVLIILVVSQSNVFAVNAGASERLANAQPSENVSIYLPLVLNTFTSISLVVTTAADIVNGDTSSPDALIANPGADGISLREAILAVNNGSGAFTVITFSPSLAGSIIVLSDQLLITQSNVNIDGFDDESGKPEISIQINEHPRGGFNVKGSYIAIRNFRMIGLSVGGGRGGVFLEPDSGGTITNVLIEGNIFEGSGNNSSNGISLRNDDDVFPTTMRNITIIGNTFTNIQNDTDCIHIGSRGSNSLRENIVIRENVFLDSVFPIELEAGGTNNRILNVQITQNYFANNHQAVSIGIFGYPGIEYTGNVISETLIYDNVFEHNNAAVSLLAGGNLGVHENVIHNTQVISNVIASNTQGMYIGGGSDGASNNLVSDTLIARNIFENNTNGAIGITGGGHAGSTGNVIQNTQIINNIMARNQDHAIRVNGGWDTATANRVEGVHIINNTIANNGSDVYDAAIGASIGDPGNIVSGVDVVNSILWGNTMDFEELVSGRVQFSVTTQAGFAGMNGNIAADPLFVNPALGDYHLNTGSPAIDAGTSAGAPASDFECRERFDDPAMPNTGSGIFTFYDIGAFEFQGLITQCPLGSQ